MLMSFELITLFREALNLLAALTSNSGNGKAAMLLELN